MSKAKSWETNFLPLMFRCSPWVVKEFLSSFSSWIFTFDWDFINFCTCLLYLVTSKFTHDSGIKSNLYGEFINTIFSPLFSFTNLETEFNASFITYIKKFNRFKLGNQAGHATISHLPVYHSWLLLLKCCMNILPKCGDTLSCCIHIHASVSRGTYSKQGNS